MDTQKTYDADTRDLTTAEMIDVDGGGKHVLPIGPIDGIPPIGITPIIGPIVVELDPLTL